MRRWFRGGRLFAPVAVAVLMAVTGIVTCKRLRGPDAAQARALQPLRVPAADVDAVYAADRQRWRELPARGDAAARRNYVSVAAKRFAHLPELNDHERQMLCFAREQDCAAKARAHALTGMAEISGVLRITRL